MYISNLKVDLKQLFLIISLIFINIHQICSQRQEILMPSVSTQKEDAYMCTSYQISDTQKYITNIEPLTNMDIAHHMFAFGCEQPAVKLSAWNCESMVCNGPKTILFAWGRNAPKLDLPDDVAFKVGPNTQFKYIVVNIHYLKKINNDNSGLAVTFTDKPRPNLAGIMLMVTGNIDLPPMAKKYNADISCKYEGRTLNVFAFRVHAHYHGDVNTAYRIRNHEWKQVAKGDPQLPQAFYKTSETHEIKDGDILVARCSYHNDEDRHVYAGATHQDEMCNVYLMYYTDGETNVQEECAGNSYPQVLSLMPPDAEVKPPAPDSKVSKYTLINNWLGDVKMGDVGGVAIDSQRGNIIIFHRGSQTWQADSFSSNYRFNSRKYIPIKEDTIIVIDSNTGKLVKSWGKDMFLMPHGITLDPMGNVWVTDVGRHQVVKFSYTNPSTPLLEVGEREVPGNDRTHFCQPADVAVMSNGEFFVADGYCNSRIVRFDKNGVYKMEWSSDEQGLPGNFFIPHALALHEASSLICVADRENYRIQCFDLQGTFLHQATSNDFGPIYGVSFASNNGSILYAINGYAFNKEVQYEKKIFLIQVTTGNVIATINIDQDLAVKPHEITVNNDASEIYIGLLNPPKILKYALVNYDIQRKPNNTDKNGANAYKPNSKTNLLEDRENFRTSMFIMAFLAVPLVLVIIIAVCIRLRNMGKLRNLSDVLQNHADNDLSKWIKSTNKNKNGFARLNQDSDNEAEPLDPSGSDSDEINVPLSKA